MAAKFECDSEVGSSSMDSGYATAKPVNLSSLNSVEKLENALSKTVQKNKQLEEEIQKYKRQMLDSQRTINSMRAAKDNLKGFNVRQAQNTNEKLRKENKSLLGIIEEREKTIKILKQNKKDIREKLSRTQNVQSKPPVSKVKIDDSDALVQEIQVLKQKLHDQALQIEVNDKFIANQNKLSNKTLHEIKEMKDMMLETKQREAERDHTFKEILRFMKGSANNLSDAQNENQAENTKVAKARKEVGEEPWHYK